MKTKMKVPILLSVITSISLGLLSSPGYAADAASPAIAEAAADGKFLHSAAYGGTGGIQYSDVAESRTKREEVKNFAIAMGKDHKEMAKQLSTVGGRVNVKLPSDLTVEQKDTLAKLKDASDADFDRMYMDTMVADHKKAIAIFEDAAKNSTNPEVKTFATVNLPHLQGHLNTAELLAKKLGSIDAK